MAAKSKPTRYTSPKGIASYPYLNKPDTKFKPEGEYKVDLVFAPGVLDEPVRHKDPEINGKSTREIIELMLDEKYKETVAAAKPQDKKKISTVSPVHEQYDDQGEATGSEILKFRLKAHVKTQKVDFKQTPVLFDAKRKETDVAVYSGSELRVVYEIVPYYSPKDKEVGVSLRMKAVQIIELSKSTGGAEYGSMFDEEEGFESDEEGYTADMEGDDDSEFDGGGAGEDDEF